MAKPVQKGQLPRFLRMVLGPREGRGARQVDGHPRMSGFFLRDFLMAILLAFPGAPRMKVFEGTVNL